MIKPLTKQDIKTANKDNPCFIRECPKCGCDVIDQKIAHSKIFIEDAWVSGCPRCNYSFCD